MSVESSDKVILFDGVCNLCNWWVNFAIDRDPQGHLKFGALQSEAGMALLSEIDWQGPELGSLVFVEAGQAYQKSTGVLRACRYLRFPWPLARVFFVVPRPLRDWVYEWIARNRYRWFGERDQCRVPEPGVETRFIG